MGEAPACFNGSLQNGQSKGLCVNSKECDKSVEIANKVYVIGGTDDECALSLGVQVYDKQTGNWVVPTVLGTKPKSCKDRSVIALNDGRILVIKKGSASGDSIWFLEVDTPFIWEQKKSLGTEVIAWSKGVGGNAEKPVVISGPSGVGKGTLISMLMKEFPTMFGFSVSHTTRAPRGMEKNGVHYHFTDKSVMEKEIKDGKFLEFASVHGNLYGTSIEAVEVVADSGKRCILDIDVQGARSVRASSLEAIFIFVCPPSMKELEDRLRARGTETEEQILKRLRNAEAEINQGKSSGTFDHILYNDRLEECYENLKKLLGLDIIAPVTEAKPGPEGINLHSDHTVSEIDGKIVITGAGLEPEKATKNSIILDVSSLTGGAPGRTRGLSVYAMDSPSNYSSEIDKLS